MGLLYLAAPLAQAVPNNLPAQRDSFVGRRQEIVEVKLLLRTHQLVTLTGPGGCGKSRLALRVAEDEGEVFPDGTFFVRLDSIQDPALVLPTIARSLGVRETNATSDKSDGGSVIPPAPGAETSGTGQPLLDKLKAHLDRKRLLLLLDTFERVLQSGCEISQLLETCHGLKVLVTSQERLRVRGEKEFPVPPLSMPAGQRLPSAEVLAEYEAVALFTQRAKDAWGEFVLTDENAPAVVEICHRLDGLPLAIELAAPHIRNWSPQTLLARLELRLPVLTEGARDLPVRHQTLRNTIAWSYDRLSEGEQRLFRRLSVFAGGCTLEAAEAVCNADDDQEVDVEVMVASLLNKNLLRQEGNFDGKRRLRMLETIREYGQEQLEVSGEAEAVRLQCALFFLHLAEFVLSASEEGSEQQEQDRTLSLTPEGDNFLAVLNWALKSGEVGLGLQIGGALGTFWLHRGYVSEARKLLSAFLDRDASEPKASSSVEAGLAMFFSRIRTRALNTAAQLALFQGGLLEAQTYLEEHLAIAESLGDRAMLGYTLVCLGHVAESRGDHDVARALYQQSLLIHQERADQQSTLLFVVALDRMAQIEPDPARVRSLQQETVSTLQRLAESGAPGAATASLALRIRLVTEREGPAAARSILEQTAYSLKSQGDSTGTVALLMHLALLAQRQADYRVARSFLEQSLIMCREMKNLLWTIPVLQKLGEVALQQGDYQAARNFLGEGLAIGRQLDHPFLNATSLQALGKLALRQADIKTASLLLEESLAIWTSLGYQLGMAQVLMDLGVIAISQGQGHRECTKALNLYRSMGDTRNEARCLSAFGEGYQTVKQYEQARKYYAEALEVYRKAGDAIGQAHSITRLGNVHRDLQELEQARERYLEALELFRSANAKSMQANSLRALADLDRRLKQYDQAVAQLQEALGLYRDAEDKSGEARCLLDLGDFYAEQKA